MEDSVPAAAERRGLVHIGFRRDAIFLFAVLSAGNVSSYLFHTLMTRLLGPSDYGALGALLGALLVLTVPTAAVQAVVARRTAVLPKNDREALRALLWSSLRVCGAAGAVLAVALSASAPWSNRFLHMDSVEPVVLLALVMIPSFVTPVGRGALQGAMRFRAFGFSLLASAVLRLLLGAALVEAGLGVSGAVLGILLAEIAGVGIVLVPLRKVLIGRRSTDPGATGLAREGLVSSLALLAFWLLVSIDVILARHYLSAEAAGVYAAAALVGRAVLFLPAAIAMVAYPRFAGRPSEAESRRLLAVSLGAVAAIGAAASAGVALFPEALSVAFGGAFRSAANVAPLLALAMTGFGAVSVLVYQRLALGRAPVRSLWLAVAVETALIAVFHGGPTAVAATVCATGWILAGMLWLGSSRRVRVVGSRSGELWETRTSDVDLSVITPTYNGAATLAPNLEALLSALQSANIRYEIILVSDGSTDTTVDVARPYLAEGVRLLHYRRNRGKGYALRMGMRRATGSYVAFIDSDGDLDPGELVRFLTLMKLYRADMVIGSKRHPLSEVSYPRSRRLMSWTYQNLVRLLFGVRVRDTQTGIKLIRRDVLAEVLPRLVEKRFAFDLELIVAARCARYRRILEAPVRLRFHFTSTVSRRAVVGIALDTMAIWYRRYVVRQYDREVEPGRVGVAPAPPSLALEQVPGGGA